MGSDFGEVDNRGQPHARHAGPANGGELTLGLACGAGRILTSSGWGQPRS